nr:DUF222 domain-containing protein [Geodermatophilaceae bacterium]
AADPAAAEARRRSARDDRRVSLHPGHDGMSHLHAVLPEPQALRWYDALTATAHAAAADDDQRGIDQLRADTLLDLLLQPPSDSPVAGPTVATDADTPTGARRRSRWGTRPTTVHVTVPWTTLTGITDDPGDLAGYGPITAAHARELAADATWRRILTDPESGTILDVGTTVYAPPAAIARHVRTRDRTCRFPGCRQPATRCDLDHTVPHPHGPTAETNLNTLCRRHHRTKTFTRSRLQHLPGAVMAWTSPTGHTYRTYPWAPDPPERRTEEPPPF